MVLWLEVFADSRSPIAIHRRNNSRAEIARHRGIAGQGQDHHEVSRKGVCGQGLVWPCPGSAAESARGGYEAELQAAVPGAEGARESGGGAAPVGPELSGHLSGHRSGSGGGGHRVASRPRAEATEEGGTSGRLP